MREPFQMLEIDRKKYTDAMAENLPALRARIGLSQEQLAGLIGVTRQTISAIENKSRELSWPTFLSLLFLFSRNEDTRKLLYAMGIYDGKLEACFTFTNLEPLQ